MKVVPLGYERSLSDIASDARTQELANIVAAHRELLGLVFTVVRRIFTLDELERGRDGKGYNLSRLVESYRVRPSLLARRRRVGELLEDLYRAFHPGENRVRGAVLEALLERHLVSRYGGPGEMLENNLKFAIGNGSARYSSGEKSIDVFGFDGLVGECHDCKVNPGKFDPDWVHELQDDVAPLGFKIGLVTATDSRTFAEAKIARSGIRVSPTATTIITAEDFHPRVSLPLQPRI